MSWNNQMAKEVLDGSSDYAQAANHKRKFKISLDVENEPFMIITKTYLKNGEVLSINNSEWTVIGSEGLGMFAQPEVKTYRCYVVLIKPIFAVNDKIKEINGLNNDTYEVIEVQDHNYRLKKGDETFNMLIPFQDTFNKI
jgi:hypothetical protein